MSELQRLLSDSAGRLFAELAERASGDPAVDFATHWPAVVELGLPLLMVAEADGGAGGGHQDLRAVLSLAGVHTLAAPLGETVLGNAALAAAGLPLEEGALSWGVAAQDTRIDASGLFSGTLNAVRFGRMADAVVTVALQDGAPRLVKLARAEAASVVMRQNLAGEPIDILVFDKARGQSAATALAPDDVLLQTAFIRTCLIEGVLAASLSLTVEYAKTRVQFGKPLAAFQALQHQLAQFAEQAAAVAIAALGAARAADCGDAAFEMMAAKLRANIAVGACTDIAHQLHGAIGITREHALHRFTPRLWSWRSEGGNDRHWAERLGAHVVGLGPQSFWAELTARSDRRVGPDAS